MYEAQIDAVEEYTNKLIDSYNEYIDTVKEAIDAERELYEFKKDIAKQTKDIAELERRIASLSGSDNAADIAERRKLEAELAEAKEGLNDSYYAHSKDALQNALEDEATAYEKTMNKFIEKLRESLETATQDMDLFMQGILAAVIANAPSILEQYDSLGIALDDAITNPWGKATEAIIKYGGVDGLGIMNSWINDGGAFPTFKDSATTALTSPWNAGKTALGSFKSSIDTEMKNIVKIIKDNVQTAKGSLSSLANVIQDTNEQASNSSVNTSNVNTSNVNTSSSGNYSGGSNYNNGNLTTTQVKELQKYLKVDADGKWGAKSQAAAKEKWGVTSIDEAWNKYGTATKRQYVGRSDYKILGSQSFVDKNTYTKYGIKYYKDVGGTNHYVKLSDLKKVKYDGGRSTGWAIPKGSSLYRFYAKGTLGTKRDEFAITDESWIGEEITLAAGKNGQLQYLKKGSAVMPADISANLVEWGKLNPNMMNIANPSAGINLMTNYVSKPELNLSFDALVKAGSITQETLPAVKELVKQEFDRFTKQLNYSIKRVGAN